MTGSLLDRKLTLEGQIRSFLVQSAESLGWEAAERQNDQVLTHHVYADWHRVERTLMRFAMEIARLRKLGWRDLA